MRRTLTPIARFAATDCQPARCFFRTGIAERPVWSLGLSVGTVRSWCLPGKIIVRRYGSPAPPEDALGDLHRYRDAIIETPNGRAVRTVEEAVALFPYREPEPGAFASSRLWTAIGEIGVGAIPLVPGETGYLERWLRCVLGAGA